jgi:RNA polymerase sigma-70 factor (ECF subfamily)
VNARIPSQHHAEISDCYKQHWDRLYRYLFWRTDCDCELSKDLVQQVMMEVAKGWEEFRLLGDERLAGLLYHIADKRAIDAGRHDRVIREHTCPMPPEYPAPLGEGTEETAIAAITIEHFISVMRSLPKRQAEAARLYWFDELSNAEIAKELGISRGAVTRLLSKARARLQAELSSYLSGSDCPGAPEGGAGS